MARLPQPGGDNGNWGSILNDYLLQALKPDGTIKDNAVTNNAIAPDAITATEIQDGSIQEAQLANAVQTKLNAAGDWNTLSNKPVVVAAGANAAAARSVIGAASTNDVAAVASTPVLARQTLSIDTPLVAFNNIPAGYGDLLITGQVRATNASTNTQLRMTLNNRVLDSNYLSQRMRATSTTVDASALSALPYFTVAEITGGTAAATTAAGQVEIHLPNYDGTVFDQEFYSDYHYSFGTGSSQYVGRYGGRYQGGPAAVRSIILTPAAGSFKAGTTFTLYGRSAANPLATSDSPVNLVFEGDSLTASATGGGTNYPLHLQAKIENALMTNVATAGETLVDMTSQAATQVDSAFIGGIDNYLLIWGGTNDLTLVTDPDGPTIYGRYTSYCTARRAAGFKVVAFTLLPRSSLTVSRQTALDYFNAQVRANWASFADHLHDVAAIPQFSNPDDTTYYADGLHLNDTGREINASAIATLLGAQGVALAS